MHSYQRYLVQLALVFFLTLALVAGFNILVDVHGVFGTPDIGGINAVKHGPDRHARIAKAYAVTGYRPHSVILGTSRAESLLDPGHPFFAGRRVYNLALPGASLYEQLRYLQHATVSGDLRSAYFTIDFHQFIAEQQRVSGDFSEGRLAVDSEGRQTNTWHDVLSLLFGAPAFKDSWWSIRHQKSHPSIYRRDGYRSDENDIPPMLEKPDGQRGEFRGSERGYVRVYSVRGSTVANSVPIARNPYDDLRVLQDWALRHRIDLTMIIPPVHVRHLLLIKELGLWSRFEDWKRQLADMRIASSTDKICRVWDFAMVMPVSTEEVPPSGSREPMRWWRESSHATVATGNKVLDVIAGAQEVVSESPPFGKCLVKEGLEAYLAAQRQALDSWAATHPGELAEIRQLAGAGG